VNALSTWCREGAPGAFVERARALGVREVALEATVDADELAALVPALLGAGISIVAFAAPCPRPRGPRRPPRLATEDVDERLAAAAQAAVTIARAAELGARVVLLELGTVMVRVDHQATLRAFARRQLEESDIARLVSARRALSPRALDLARHGLDPLLDRAAAAGVTLGLALRPWWFDIPTSAETAQLLAEFRGAPLAPWYDAAAAHIRQALGFGQGRPAVEIETAAGAWLTDAAGPLGGLPWGTGDVDPAVLAKLPDGALRVVHAAAPVSDEELAQALV
jgi:hypothetical protein